MQKGKTQKEPEREEVLEAETLPKITTYSMSRMLSKIQEKNTIFIQQSLWHKEARQRKQLQLEKKQTKHKKNFPGGSSGALPGWEK